MFTCLSGASLAPAQQPTELKVAVGFQDHVKLGAWAPVRVIVDNTRGTAARGELVIPRQPITPREEYRVRLDLPPSSRRAFMLYVRFTEVTSPLRVELRLQGRRPLTVDAPCSPHGVASRLVLAISRTAGGLSFIGAVPLPGPPSNDRSAPAHDSAVAYAVPDSATGALGLPDQPVGYSSLSAVVIRDISPSSFQPEEQDALVKWVQGGGLLVIVAGPNAGELRDSFLEKLSPVRLRGQRTVQGLDRLAARFMGQLAPGEALVADTELAPGAEPIAVQDGVPILARRRAENGTVYFLAADSSAPPLRDADRLLIAMWTDILREASTAHAWTPPTADPDRQAGGLETGTVRLPVVDWDAFAIFGGFLLAYIVFLVPLNRLVLRRVDRREWTGWAVLLFVFLFSAGSLYLGKASQLGSSRTYEAAVARARSGSSVAWIDGVVGLRSPNERQYAISAPDTGRSLECLIASQRVPPPWVDEENGFRLPQAAVDLWGFGAFRVEGPLDLGGRVTAQLAAIDGRNLAVVVENHTPHPLIHPFVLTGGGMHAVEELAPDSQPGSTRQSEPVSQSELSSSGWGNGPMPSFAMLAKHCDAADERGSSAEQRMRNRLLTQLTGVASSSGGGSGLFGSPLRRMYSGQPRETPPPPSGPVFGAWVKLSGPLVSIVPRPGTLSSEVLLLVDIPVDPSLVPPAIRPAALPPGPPVLPSGPTAPFQTQHTSTSQSGGTTHTNAQKSFQIQSGTRELTFSTPLRGHASVTRIEVNVSCARPGLSAGVKNVRRGYWYGLNVGLSQALPSPGDYINPATGEVTVRVSNPGQQPASVSCTVSVTGRKP